MLDDSISNTYVWFFCNFLNYLGQRINDRGSLANVNHDFTPTYMYIYFEGWLGGFVINWFRERIDRKFIRADVIRASEIESRPRVLFLNERSDALGRRREAESFRLRRSGRNSRVHDDVLRLEIESSRYISQVGSNLQSLDSSLLQLFPYKIFVT